MASNVFKWTVIGAGPAGMAAVGKLLDHHVPARDILWLDPYFEVGDLGRYWRNVSSNTKAKFFTAFLEDILSFDWKKIAHQFLLNQLNLEDTCLLSSIVEPLEYITQQLLRKVTVQKDMVHHIFLKDRVWNLKTHHAVYYSEKVILATGSVPSSLDYPGVHVLPLETAIDREKLLKEVNLNATYGVFGSSHSAMIILKNLLDLGVKQVLNFYRSPCKYAIEMDDWILFDNTGLKGHTADWSRMNIDGRQPENLKRLTLSDEHIDEYLPQCHRVIYAVGFQRRQGILVGHHEQIQVNPNVGILGPGLFGLGIAYPQIVEDRFGNIEAQVGLWKFVKYLNQVMPLWFRYST